MATHIPKVYVDGREFVPKLAPAIHKDQTLAQYLMMLREQVGLSIDDVAAITGLRDWQVTSFEKNTSTLRFSEAALLARCYGVSLDLFGARVMAIVDDATPGMKPPFIGGDGQVQVVQGEVAAQLQEPTATLDAVDEAVAAIAHEEDLGIHDMPGSMLPFDPELEDEDEFVEGDPAPEDTTRPKPEEEPHPDDKAPDAPEPTRPVRSGVRALLGDL